MATGGNRRDANDELHLDAATLKRMQIERLEAALGYAEQGEGSSD